VHLCAAQRTPEVEEACAGENRLGKDFAENWNPSRGSDIQQRGSFERTSRDVLTAKLYGARSSDNHSDKVGWALWYHLHTQLGEQRMRSDLVFEAVHTLRNRYMLCQLASKATRKFHRPNTRIQDTTNDVLHRIADAERQNVIVEPETASEAQRRAA
jgi:hypothetical protein